MRVRFDEVSEVIPSGAIIPRMPLLIGSVLMTPGVVITSEVSFSGVEITKEIDHDLDVAYHTDGTAKIEGIFQ